jgi:hypothetical protein
MESFRANQEVSSLILFIEQFSEISVNSLAQFDSCWTYNYSVSVKVTIKKLKLLDYWSLYRGVIDLSIQFEVFELILYGYFE